MSALRIDVVMFGIHIFYFFVKWATTMVLKKITKLCLNLLEICRENC